MKKIAFFALLMAGIIGWAVRDEAKAPGSSAGSPQNAAKKAPPTREQYAQMVSDNARMRSDLKAKYPQVWNDLAMQSRRDIGTCVITEILPGVLKADCR
jgi:hypothetical protein